MTQIRKLTFLPEEVNSNRSIKKQNQKNNKLITSPRFLMVNPKFPWRKPKWVCWQQRFEYIEKTSEKPQPQPDRYNK